MNRWLAFGLSGAVGAALRRRLVPGRATIDALSRSPQVAAPGLRWHRGGLENAGAFAAEYAAVLSLGPLDAFAAWYARHAPRSDVVVALGSTGVHDKRHSPDAGERALAARLAQAEAALAEAVKRRGSRLVLLRPCLLWGPGTQALAPLIGIARRCGVLPLPRGATGLRQPVHVDDVAAAVLAAVEGDFAGRFDLPGGETLAWNAMVRRALEAEAPGTRVMAISDSLLALGVAMARVAGRGRVLARVPLARLRRDQVHDGAPAAAAWGWAPRRYLPRSGDHTQEHCLSVTNN